MAALPSTSQPTGQKSTEWAKSFAGTKLKVSRLIIPSRFPLPSAVNRAERENGEKKKKKWYFVTKIVLTYCEKKLF